MTDTVGRAAAIRRRWWPGVMIVEIVRPGRAERRPRTGRTTGRRGKPIVRTLYLPRGAVSRRPEGAGVAPAGHESETGDR